MSNIEVVIEPPKPWPNWAVGLKQTINFEGELHNLYLNHRFMKNFRRVKKTRRKKYWLNQANRWVKKVIKYGY